MADVGARGRGRGRGRAQPVGDVFAKPAAAASPNVDTLQKAMSEMILPNGRSGPPTVINGQLVMNRNSAQAQRGGNETGLNRRPRRLVYTEEDILMDQQPADKTGKSGQPVQVLTNYAGFRALPNCKIFMYDANFSIAVKAKFVPDRYRLLKTLQERGELAKCAVAYDGRLVFTTAPLSESDQLLVKISDANYIAGSEGGISLRKICEIPPNTEQWYRVVNVIFGLCQQLLGQKKYGDDFFVEPSRDLNSITFANHNEESFVPQRFKLRDSFELLQGYSVSLHRCSFNDKVMPIMYVGGTHRLANLNTAADELERNGPRAAAGMPGRTVLTRHNNRTYIIVDVMQNCNIDDTFDVGSDKLSYRNYFQQRYGIQLTRTKQSFLKLKLRRVDRIKRLRRSKEAGDAVANAEVPQDIMIPSELCFLTGFSEQEKATFQRDRDFNQMCRKQPNQRAADVSRFCQFVTSKDDTKALLRDWNLDVAPQPLAVQARVLDCCYRRDQMFRGMPSLNARSIKVTPPKERSKVVNLAVVQGGPRVAANMVQGYVAALQKEVGMMDFTIQWNGQLISGNTSLSDKLMQAKGQGVDMVLIALDDQNKYKEIKSTAIEQGILTQVVRPPTIGKTMTAQKVALQIACKIGFAPWRLSQGLPNATVHDYMIVGIDTFAGKGASSVQASVFSLDPDCTQYFTFVNYLQGRNMEMHANLDVAFKEALCAYKRRNNKLPSRILIYRDGVGDSQLYNMRDTEVKCLETMLATEYGSTPYHLVFTVVKKRISQRFFTRKPDGSIVNVAPGTIVDSYVTKPKWLEYYIVPQDAGQGTATPSNFNIVYNNRSLKSDTLHLSVDDLQRATFALTHLYFNWSGTIRVPAPVQYAHKCAFLLGQCAINSAIHRNIRENLFYL